jgi:ABC-type Fe3+-hydroxamate transport system substrate-binding protein
MIRKLLAIIVLVMVATLSIAGCTSSTSSNQAASRASPTATTNAVTNTKTSKATVTVTVTATPTHTPSVTPSTPAGGTPTLTLTGPATISNNEGGGWQLYINGQIPTEAQAAQISWSSTNPAVPQSEPIAKVVPYGRFDISITGAVNTAPGTYSITATYQGVSTSATYTRIANAPARTMIDIVFPSNLIVQTGSATLGVARSATCSVTCGIQTFNGQGPINGGPVTVALDGATIASGSPTNGVFAFTINTDSMSLGTHTINVSYSGTSQYAPSSTSETFIVE